MNNDTLRLIFVAVLAISILILWQRWERWEQPTTEQLVSNESFSEVQKNFSGDDSLPGPTQPLLAKGEEESIVSPGIAIDTSTIIAPVETDWLSVAISDDGANLAQVGLKKHLRENGSLLPLLAKDNGRVFVAQSGLIDNSGKTPYPYHNTKFQKLDNALAFSPSDDEALSVSFIAEAGGIVLTKTYVFHNSDYLVNVLLQAENIGDEPLSPYGYFQLASDGQPAEPVPSFLPSFIGVAMFTEESKFIKVPFDELNEATYPRKSQDGWIGFIQRYFVASWLPEIGDHEFFIRSGQDGIGRAGVILPFGVIAPGESKTVSAQLFVGAQEQDVLNRLHEDGTAPGIHLAVDYGWLTFIAVLLYKMLAIIHGVVGNWGVAIIFLTLGVKLLFYPLSAASYRSMAKMKEASPRIKRLQEKFGDDKRKMQQEMMDLYRQEKINPLGGCLPILVQIPVFIALYWVLLGSVELRHAPFILWIHDLAAPDPFYILPVIMGISMFLQTRLSPAPPDPTMAMMMRMMPIFFAIFSVFFPAGLVLYWLVNTLLSMAQQLYITRSIARARGK